MDEINIIKLLENRVRRNYTGGKDIDIFKNKKNPVNSNKPEEWIGSIVKANNVGLKEIKNEGLSYVYHNNKEYLLKDIIEINPKFYLGEKHIKKFGNDMGFLMKLLNSSMRLHTQAHPTREFAKKYLNSNWGKMECYCVLSTKNNSEGYIRLGFQKDIDKLSWKNIIKNQKIEEMNALFDKIPIKSGDIVYIPGGVPHAIGEDILLIEVMEPSDLVVRCEFEREGITVPEDARFMGKSLDFCLDIFDYTKYSIQDVQNNFFLKSKIIESNDNFEILKLVDSNKTINFEVFKIIINNNFELDLDKRFLVGLVTKGSIEIQVLNDSIKLERGDSFFLPSASEKISVINHSKNSEVHYTSNVL